MKGLRGLVGIMIGWLFVAAIGTFILGCFAILPPTMQRTFLAIGYWKMTATFLGTGVISLAVFVRD